MKALFLTLGLLISITSARQAFGFDIFPEFHGLSEHEASELDRTSIIDSEYQSDFITYFRSSDWDSAFHAKSMAYDLSLGSFNHTHFLHHDRLKLHKKLSGSLQFRFTYFKQRDFDVDQSHAILELVQNLTSRFSLSVYGQPSHFKRQNDLGVALLIHLSPTHELRLYNTWIDFTRLEQHNDRSDRFIKGSEPIVFGLTDRWYSGENDIPGQFFETFVRIEPSVRWDIRFDQHEYKYRMTTIGTASRLALKSWPQAYVNTRLQFSKKFEGFTPYSTSSSKSQSSLKRYLVQSAFSLEAPPKTIFGRQAVIEPGIGWFHRSWRDHQNQYLDHRNLVANIWLKLNGPERAPGQYDTLAIGYESTFFSSSGDLAPAADQLKAWAVEHRANLRYSFAFHENASLAIALSGDIDAAIRGSGGLFEGGNGQFRIFF